MTPRVSVLIAAHQAERTVGAAVASVLSQSIADELELVVVDDGSRDATADIVAAHGERVRLVRQEHSGVAAARNRALEKARAPLVTFCDADDFLLPQHVEALVAAHSPRRLVTANAWLLYPGGLRRGRTRFRGRYPADASQRLAILEQNFVSIMTLFPRDLVTEIGAFREDLQTAEDWDFWLRAIYAGWRVDLQPRPLALVRWGDASLTADRDQVDADIRTVLQAVSGRADLSEPERTYVQRRLSGEDPRQLGRAGDRALRDGRYSEAAGMYRRAAALSSSERPLVWKSRVLSAAPFAFGPLLRSRQLKREASLGLSDRHVR